MGLAQARAAASGEQASREQASGELKMRPVHVLEEVAGVAVVQRP